MKLLPIFFIFVIASLLGIVFAVSVLAFEDPCADGGCEEPDPCADDACEPEQPPVPFNNPPLITQFNLPSSASPGALMSIPVTAIDDDGSKVASIKLLDGSNLVFGTFNCGNAASCSHTFTAIAPNTYSTSYTYKVNAADAAGLSAVVAKSGTTTAAPPEPVFCTLYSPGQTFTPGTVIHGGLPNSLAGRCSTLDGRAECQSDGTWRLLACFEDDGA
jgi:hypothetical protein